MLASIEKMNVGYLARFERHLEHPVDEVWAWLTENEKLAKWFPELKVHELRKGGYITFDLQDGTFDKLEITDFEVNSVFEFTWWVDLVRFELDREPGGGCQLVLKEKIAEITDHTPKDLAGWHVCLDVIEALMDGRLTRRMEEWKKWYEKYVQATGRLD